MIIIKHPRHLAKWTNQLVVALLLIGKKQQMVVNMAVEEAVANTVELPTLKRNCARKQATRRREGYSKVDLPLWDLLVVAGAVAIAANQSQARAEKKVMVCRRVKL